MSQLKPAELWQMSPSEFNKWRRENDLKLLFDSFQKGLPHFDDWLNSNNLSIDFILSTDKPGQFFYWDKNVYCEKSIKGEFTRYAFYQVYDEKQEQDLLKSLDKPKEGETTEYRKFTPYFVWVKEIKGIAKPVKTRYSGDWDTFRYVLGNAAESPEHCEWVITPGVTVLKLGGTRIESWLSLYGRNLDFTNLDFLEIEGKGSWSTGIEIFYSHCANMKLMNVEANFAEFYECYFMKLSVYNSRLYGITLTRCELFQSYFENVSISSLLIIHSAVSGLSFNRVETDTIYYFPPKKHYYESQSMSNETISKNFKQLRVLYQSNGMRQEASESYYKERLYEMKGLWAKSQLLKATTYVRKYSWSYAWEQFKKSAIILVKFLSNFISYAIWGFGERPLRILATALLIILSFSFIYMASPINHVSGDFINSLYFSVVTFTTLGYGDISPMSSGAPIHKILVAIEALAGAFCMGLIVAGFANKSRH